jgi:acyl carrier protein
MDTLPNLTALIAEHAVIDADQIGHTDTLGDLGFDSLDIVELVLDIEEQFEIDLPETSHPETTTTVAQIHDLIQTLQAA